MGSSCPQKAGVEGRHDFITMLVSWELWKEINLQVFGNQSTTSTMLVSRIKDKVVLWCIVGA
jgi:hypothetical protein